MTNRSIILIFKPASVRRKRILRSPQSLSTRSLFFSSSSFCLAVDLTPSPDFCDFSTMPHALSTNDGTVSCFSCLGISTSVQYCVSSRMTSYGRGKTKHVGRSINSFRTEGWFLHFHYSVFLTGRSWFWPRRSFVNRCRYTLNGSLVRRVDPFAVL